MHLHMDYVTKDVLIGRGYARSDGYLRRDPFTLVFTAIARADRPGELWIVGALRQDGTRPLDKALLRQLGLRALELGFHTLSAERHGHERRWVLADYLKLN